ncbi:DUF4249 domain-containing protein [Pontibacter sp. Tf4]|uniref:DUF4249 domain-containing protein n=1 Tax=Pontibacter sp. Tf4 TaxID=2761620 RepID=UPI00162A2519|nr:DUF4249 domain-containing protein [Pontibacter sp. Tf4]MBB6612505.1 DUF4249 domain-containing protein [Pontibacter sp. Tf4]
MKRLLYLLPLFFIVGCNMEKEIEIVLPAHEPQLVVECYIEDGFPFEATVLESSSYFDYPAPPVVPSAQVYIMYRDQRVKLNYSPGYNSRTNRYFTHITTVRAQPIPGETYSLEVTDDKGRKVTGFTTILPKVPITNVEWRFNEKDKALLLTTFQDDPAMPNYYRYMTHGDTLKEGSLRDFTTSDELTNGKETTYGSGYDYEEGDTLIISLFHIEKQYYDFLRSVRDAQNANGNPFAQPARVKSSLQGGIGIFTNLAFDRDTVIIKK